MDILMDALAEEHNLNYLEIIEYRTNNKIYLKRAIPNQLTELGYFSNSLANKIITLSKKDLIIEQISDSLKLSSIQKIILSNCATVSEPNKLDYYSESKLNAQEFTPKSKGYNNNIFKGSSVDYNFRTYLDFNYGKLYVLNSKDAGEELRHSFTSISYAFETNGINGIIGDYSLNSGLGLILSQAFASRKSVESINSPSELNNSFYQNRSTYSNSFMRGVLINRKFDNTIDISLFYSSKKISASVDSISGEITSISSSGLFRNYLELSKYNTLNQNIFGLIFSYSSEALTLGINSVYIAHDKSVNSTSSNAFSGKSGVLNSLFASYKIDKFKISGEFGFDSKQYFGAKCGLFYDKDILKISLGGRYYKKLFRSPLGSNFGENGYPSNEVGLFFGFDLKKFLGGELASYFDVYQSLGATYLSSSIVKGIDYFARYDFKLSKRLDGYLKIEYENKSDFGRDSLNYKTLFKKSKYGISFDVIDDNDKFIHTSFKIAATYVSFEEYKSAMFNFLGAFKFKYYYSEQLNFEGRIAYGSGDEYDSALWYFYSIGKGSFNSAAFYGKIGMYSAKIEYNPFQNFSFNLCVSKIFKNSEKTLGSGYDQINSNSKYSFFLQIFWAYKN